MATSKYNITELYAKAFGSRLINSTKRFNYRPGEPGKTNDGSDFPQQDYKDYTEADRGEYGLSLIGTPYFMPTKINGVRLPNEPIIEISGGKRIVKTQIDGKQGTFKQLYSIEDFRITIRGLCINEDGSNDFPQEQVRQLVSLFNEDTHLRLVNTLANMCGIEYMAVESFELPGQEGLSGAQPYIIAGLSDNVIKLEIEENG